MKLLNAIHKYDVFLFSWLLHTSFHENLARFSRYVPRTGDGELYVLTMLLLYWHEGSNSIPIQALLFAFVIETSSTGASAAIDNKIIVHLPFEDTREVLILLTPFNNFEFHVYTQEDVQSGLGFIVCKPLSREGFQQDLVDCAGIISTWVLSWPAKPCNWVKKSW
jgi:hypothetical protein